VRSYEARRRVARGRGASARRPAWMAVAASQKAAKGSCKSLRRIRKQSIAPLAASAFVRFRAHYGGLTTVTGMPGSAG
jgi:hypothetical protein